MWWTLTLQRNSLFCKFQHHPISSFVWTSDFHLGLGRDDKMCFDQSTNHCLRMPLSWQWFCDLQSKSHFNSDGSVITLNQTNVVCFSKQSDEVIFHKTATQQAFICISVEAAKQEGWSNFDDVSNSSVHGEGCKARYIGQEDGSHQSKSLNGQFLKVEFSPFNQQTQIRITMQLRHFPQTFPCTYKNALKHSPRFSRQVNLPLWQSSMIKSKIKVLIKALKRTTLSSNVSFRSQIRNHLFELLISFIVGVME